MRRAHFRLVLILIVFPFLTLSCARSPDGPQVNGVQLNTIKLPLGFQISLYAPSVPGARSMVLGEKGTLFVGTREEGRVYALLDHQGNHMADEVIVVAQGLNQPNGVAFRGGALYVAEANSILRYDSIEERLRNPPKPVVVYGNFPNQELHSRKFIRFGPDGILYVPVGVPCDVCEPEDARFGTIMRLNADGSGLEIFARGIRNTVGFDWHPETRELWFTDNGGDMLGQNIPPDELNCAPRKGLHFGFPYCHGKSVSDPYFGWKHNCSEFVAPEVELGPHVAPLGMRFYTGNMFPTEFRNQIFIAEHGSSNRTIPIGYRITLVRLERGRATKYEVFAEGWLQGRRAWGRPVDILVMPDGALLVSDDRAGVIYRISFRK